MFRGVTGIRFTSRPGRVVRFGHFASTSLLRNVSDFYGTTTTFEVDTCHGADIRDYSMYPDEEEVLIPPFETFNVTGVTQQGDNVHIHLRSHGVYSKYNCAWLQGDVPGLGTPQLAVGTPGLQIGRDTRVGGGTGGGGGGVSGVRHRTALVAGMGWD